MVWQARIHKFLGWSVHEVCLCMQKHVFLGESQGMPIEILMPQDDTWGHAVTEIQQKLKR